MAKDNRGAESLRALGKTQAEIASAIGTGQSVVCRWVSGERKPDTKYRLALQELYQIGWRQWDDEYDADAPTEGDESESESKLKTGKKANGTDPEAA